MSVNEIELMFAIQKGDENAFRQLYELYKKPLANYFFRLTFDAHEAEDLLQEAFLRLWTHAKSFQSDAKVSTFIFRVAHNLWVDEVRKRKLRKHVPEVEAGVHNSPLVTLVHQELSREVQKALESIPEGERVVLILSEYHNFKYSEIANILNIPVGTVKTRMRTGLQKLRQKVERYLQE